MFLSHRSRRSKHAAADPLRDDARAVGSFSVAAPDQRLKRLAGALYSSAPDALSGPTPCM